MTGGTLSVSGTLLVENLTVAAGASTQVQSGGLVTVRRDYTNSGYLAVWGGLVVERTFTNLATGDVDVYGNMQVDANLDNTGGNFEVHTTGDLTVNGSINNSGGTFTNSGHVYVDANLRNNPGGVLNGSGAWDVNINTINTAGGIITGGLDFCDYDVFNQCLLDNACVSLACSLSCQSTANPLVGGGGGVIDSASLMVCGIAIDAVLSGTNPILLSGSMVGEEARLVWRSNYEQNTLAYTVLRSVDGVSYEQIEQQPAISNTSSPVEYTYRDRGKTGALYYRVTRMDLDGNTVQSNVVTLTNQGALGLALYPNPADGRFQLALSGLPEGIVQIQIFNTMGLRVQQYTLRAAPMQRSLAMPVAIQLAPGTYYVRALSMAGAVQQKLIIQ
ncbi:MAG: T9SS type A sorting domain-containing protein [Bacteroidetes bacterium]|jgi:hypothetical protein|nr:T9SS type A sorting domain-containing protein [Bacteroidota bacterium]